MLEHLKGHHVIRRSVGHRYPFARLKAYVWFIGMRTVAVNEVTGRVICGPTLE